MQKIVLKVSVMCTKCKICIMTIISKFDGLQRLIASVVGFFGVASD